MINPTNTEPTVIKIEARTRLKIPFGKTNKSFTAYKTMICVMYTASECLPRNKMTLSNFFGSLMTFLMNMNDATLNRI